MPYDVLFTISFICALAVAFMCGFSLALSGVQKARQKMIDDALTLVSKIFGGKTHDKNTGRHGGGAGGTGGDQGSSGSTFVSSAAPAPADDDDTRAAA